MPEKTRQSKDEIIKCKKYIEDLMGEPIPTYALEESCGNMKVLSIIKIDAYHKIAQSLGITELLKKQNIYYHILLPDKSKWSIILSHLSPEYWKFEQTYGTNYHIKVVRERPKENGEELKENSLYTE